MRYKKLWIMLAEKEISQATFRKDLNIVTGTMTTWNVAGSLNTMIPIKTPVIGSKVLKMDAR